LGRYPESFDVLFPLVGIQDKDKGRLYSNIGLHYFHLNQFDEALAWFIKADKEAPNDQLIRENIASAYFNLGDYENATTYRKQILKQFPGNIEAIYSWSCDLLYHEQYEEGFRLYQQRWQSKYYESRHINLPFPIWNGQNIRSLILIGEQGIGDEVFMGLFIPKLLTQVETLSYICDKRLVPLLARSFPTVHLLPLADQPVIEAADFDAQLHMADAGMYAWESIGKVKHYLLIDARKKEALREKYAHLFPHKKLVGISWKSTRTGLFGDGRNPGLDHWQSLFSQSDCQFISLQYGETAQDIAYFKEHFGVDIYCDPDIDCMTDMDSLAALMHAVDVVITVTNTNAHLAAATGANVWILTPIGTSLFWCWGLDGESPFYPDATLFRAKKVGDWEPVIQQISLQLSNKH
jgi:hypothetical protein